ncbi:MAG: FAD:protein FMN transferase [Gammaproteobacteria bacterium]
MASPCELLLDGESRATAQRAGEIVFACAQRIERHFSRYRDDNIVHQINTSEGRPVKLDDETARLLDFATTLHTLSDGAFDISSGALRRVWRFDGGSHLPAPDAVKKVLADVGWQRVEWNAPTLRMAPGMEIDLGGIGKEYAVDQALAAVTAFTSASCLVNFGGDLAVSGPRANGQGWRTGVESTGGDAPEHLLQIKRGALATSGDARRYVLKDGVRYSHVLDPRTGWPIEGAPGSVTVAGDSCTQAGMLATLALLRGAQCEAFLAEQKASFWVQRA